MSDNKPTVCCGQDYKDIVNKIKQFGVQSTSNQHPHNSKSASIAATTQPTFFNLTNHGFLRYQKN
jgi:hypothetical protein